MNISVLIPSKGSPAKALRTVMNLASLAEVSSLVEYIVIVNKDADDMLNYEYMSERCRGLGLNVKLLASKFSGYLSIPDFYEEGFQASKGALIFLYNDDVVISTLHWDSAYVKALAPIPYGVAAATVDETPNPTAYTWAFPMVKRELPVALKAICIHPEGEFRSCDRMYDAYAKVSGRGVKAPVNIRHFFDCEHAKTGGERAEFYRRVHRDWSVMGPRWDAKATEMLDATR